MKKGLKTLPIQGGADLALTAKIASVKVKNSQKFSTNKTDPIGTLIFCAKKSADSDISHTDCVDEHNSKVFEGDCYISYISLNKRNFLQKLS